MSLRFAILLCLFLAGCSAFRRAPRIESQGVTVTAPVDAGKGATLEKDERIESLPIPAGSQITVTRTEAVPAIPATESSPPIPAQPGTEIVEVVVASPTEWRRTIDTVKADTGTVDQSVALAKVEAEENRILLYAAIASVVAAIAFFWLKFPTPAIACGCAAIIFFMAWKVSGLPPWFWITGLVAIAASFGLYMGFNRGEMDSRKDSQ